MNKIEILENVKKNYKKIEFPKVSSDDFGLKDYLMNFSIGDTRLNFKIKKFYASWIQN